jgi:hypothetical protein
MARSADTWAGSVMRLVSLPSVAPRHEHGCDGGGVDGAGGQKRRMGVSFGELSLTPCTPNPAKSGHGRSCGGGDLHGAALHSVQRPWIPDISDHILLVVDDEPQIRRAVRLAAERIT